MRILASTQFFRRFSLLLLTFFIGAGCFRQVNRDVVVKVPKLNSPECFRFIQEALRPLDGVQSASADFATSTVTVRYDSEKLAIRNIEFVIAGAGFAANDLPPNQQAKTKLPLNAADPVNITLSAVPFSEARADAGIVFCLGREPLLPAGSSALHRRVQRMVKSWIREHGYEGAPNRISLFPTWDMLPLKHLVLAGLGTRDAFHMGRLYRTAASAVRAARAERLRTLCLAGDLAETDLGEPGDELIQAAIQGAYFGNYVYTADRKQDGEKKRVIERITITDRPGASSRTRRAVRRASIIGKAIAEVRDLANLSGNTATPAKLASAARAMARKYGLRCTVWGPEQLRRNRCRGILTVGQGSRQTPRLITLTYTGGRKKDRPIVLAGKAITFDTGGISLKSPKSMEWMKYDKCGGMTVLAVMRIVAQLKPRQPVVGMLAAAENMPGGRAAKPGDIIRMHSGKTVEIVNTDAEGRLVLADALSVAHRYRPRAIVDVATLTGAVVSALGHDLTGVMGNDEGLVEELCVAGERSGDRLWPLPLLPEHSDALESHFADIRNVGSGGGAGSSVGAAFLKAFVPEGVRWAHLDVAGTAWEESSKPYALPGATLSGTLALVDWVLGQASRGN